MRLRQPRRELAPVLRFWSQTIHYTGLRTREWAESAAPQMKTKMGGWNRLAGRLFPRNEAIEAVATSVHFHASPEAVWQRMLLYEDVSAHPPLLLRILLPYPVSTKGDKTCVGATVQCTYTGGYLVKRIIAVDVTRLLQFDVIEQQLGIEGCITTVGGSYELRDCGGETDIVLTTNYRGHMRPRFMWRPVERLLARQLHHHILDGMRASLQPAESSARSEIPRHSWLKGATPQELPCTASPSRSHR